jgi:hypothetical protein
MKVEQNESEGEDLEVKSKCEMPEGSAKSEKNEEAKS